MHRSQDVAWVERQRNPGNFAQSNPGFAALSASCIEAIAVHLFFVELDAQTRAARQRQLAGA